MNKNHETGRNRYSVGVVLVLLFFLCWQTSSYSQKITKPVTYSVVFQPLGSGIDWQASVPSDFEPVSLLFKFNLNPGTFAAEINGDIVLNQDDQTLKVQPRHITDLEKVYVGKFEYTGGVLLLGEIVFDFVIPIPFFPDIPIEHSLPIPGFPQIDEGWDDATFFDSLLLNEDDAVQVEAGIRKLVSADLTAVEIAEILAVVLSQGALPQRIADKAGDIIKTYIGDGGIRVNGGLLSKFNLSAIGIYVDGQLITDENQTVSARGLNPTLDSYSIQSTYEEKFTAGLDLILTSDVFFNFAPFDIELWSYEKEIAEVPIPIVPELELNSLDFVTNPEPITFSIKADEQPIVNRAPVTTITIPPQTVRIGEPNASIGLSDKFSDPDGDTLTYAVESSNPAVLTTQRVGNDITILPWSAGSVTITITATDPDGLEVTQTFSVTVLPAAPTTVNRAPMPTSIIGEQTLYVGAFSRIIDMSVHFIDPDGDPLTYTAASNNTSVVSTENLGNSRVRIAPEGNGSATVTITASDGSLSTTQTFTVTVSTLLVIGNRTPEAQGAISPQTFTVGGASTTIDVANYFHDPDGDSLTYAVSSNDTNVVNAQRTGTSSILLTPTGEGSTTVTVTARDSNLSVIQTISVTVVSPIDTDINISESSDVVVENISADYVTNYPGERYTVSVTVRNAGGRRAPNVRLRYYLSDDDTYSADDEEYVNLDDFVGGLRSGESSRESVHLDAPSEEGIYYIIARTDPVENEQTSRNNYQSIMITVLPPPAPDLVVSLSVNRSHVEPNDYIKLTAFVRNQGAEDASDATTVRYYTSTDAIFSDDDQEFDTGRIKQLDDGRTDDDIEGFRAPAQPGTYYYFACIDPVDNERITDNNCSNVVEISVVGPDLVIAAAYAEYWDISQNAVDPISPFSIYTTVRNDGTDRSRSTLVRYYLSADATFSVDDDTEVGVSSVSRLSIGESSEERVHGIHAPSTKGFFYLFVCVETDPNDVEISTENNCSVPIRITVINRPPRAEGTIEAQALKVGNPLTFDGSPYFTDRNNDMLTFNAKSSDDNVVTANTLGAQITITPVRAGSAMITVTARDSEFSATQTFSVSVTVPNRAPTAVGTIAAQTLTVGQAAKVIDVAASFSDLDKDTLTYTTASDKTNIATATASGSNVTITAVSAGNATITVTASDGKLTATQTISVTVLKANSAPLAVGTISDRTLAVGDAAITIDVASNFEDPDDDDLGFTVTSDNDSVATASVSGSQVTITPVGAGSATITVTANDGTLTATQIISISVNTAVTEEEWMPDANLRAAVRSALGLSANQPLTQQAMRGLTQLIAEGSTIRDLTGLEHATQLQILVLGLNEIRDITPLANLISLVGLDLSANPISDITPLANLTSLQVLGLFGIEISDLTPLEDLINLRLLFMSPNLIGDLSPLQRLEAKTPHTIGFISEGLLEVLGSLDDYPESDESDEPDTPEFTDQPEEEWMPDANLRAKIKEALGLQAGETLTQQAMQRLTSLSAREASISDITGLEYATQLRSLDLLDNQISDISHLADLTKLTWIQLIGNQISDISPLGNLTELTMLFITRNQINDISPLGNLTELTTLFIARNQISDISSLAGLTKLTGLYLNRNQISDISSLADLTKLTYISLWNNQISDLSPLAGLTELTSLSLSQNQIRDISSLNGLTKITRLSLLRNQISDVSALRNLTTLEDLRLNENQISDITPLENLTNLTALGLSSNQISDITPLENLTNLTEVWLAGNPITDYAPLRRLQAKTSQDISIDIDITQDSNSAPSAQGQPTQTALLSNYPNPFNPETWIPYQLSKPTVVKLTIYNVRGVAVRQLALGHQAAGVYYSRSRAAHWDGKNALGEKVAAGVYFVKFTAGNYSATRKMLIRK